MVEGKKRMTALTEASLLLAVLFLGTNAVADKLAVAVPTPIADNPCEQQRPTEMNPNRWVVSQHNVPMLCDTTLDTTERATRRNNPQPRERISAYVGCSCNLW